VDVETASTSAEGAASPFLWGASASAYQIEGAIREDGRGPSIWDTFCAVPGNVRNGESGAVACDFYHHYEQDIDLMRELGLDVFRFSISWPRVLPTGRGRVNGPGLDFYDRLVDALLGAGIAPFVTLYHWDLPQPLQDAGGWPERATAEAFADYAATVGRRLGDRVRFWTTHNEPYCQPWLGHVEGLHAPGHRDLSEGVAALHHLLLSHGLAVEALRRECPQADIGVVLDSWPAHPATDDPRDRAAAWEADGIRNRLVFDPILRGAYPEDVLARLGPAQPPLRAGDLAVISAPLDFVGINNYSRTVVRADPVDGSPVTLEAAPPVTAAGWEIYPEGMFEVLTRLHHEYAVESIYVTESGAAFDDVRTHDGAVRDPGRISYLARYLDAVLRARGAGVPVHGFFVWSLLDNFEWNEGFSKRFGLVYVDFSTLERVPKSSFTWYRKVIARERKTARLPA
jgi:beta-glucosidase